MTRNIWIDCDPGHDDALALLVATNHPSVNLLGVSTVHGNSNVKNTTINASRLLHAFGASDAKIYPGASVALVREPPPAVTSASSTHGESGLDGVEGLALAEDPSVKQLIQTGRQNTAIKGLERQAEALIQQGQKMTLIAIGPLTNVALFLAGFPELAELAIENIILMGGAVDERGNTNDERSAEWNIYADPEAAHIVYQSHFPIQFFPLDITHTAIFRHEGERLLLEKNKSNLRHTLSTITDFFSKAYAQTFGFESGPPIHDLLCVIYAIEPDIFEGTACFVDVELKDEAHRGRTVIDPDSREEPANVWMARTADNERLWKVFFEAVERCDLVSPLNKQ